MLYFYTILNITLFDHSSHVTVIYATLVITLYISARLYIMIFAGRRHGKLTLLLTVYMSTIQYVTLLDGRNQIALTSVYTFGISAILYIMLVYLKVEVMLMSACIPVFYNKVMSSQFLHFPTVLYYIYTI